MHAPRSRPLVILAVLGCCFATVACSRPSLAPTGRPGAPLDSPPPALAEVSAATPPGPPAGGPGHEPPGLTVVLVVDQMRGDYLDRFGSGFTGGLRRLIDQGAVFTDAHQDHALTLTGAGHATIATGTHPRRNGIVGNAWWDRATARWVYAADDPAVKVIGFDRDPGRSPVNLLVPTLGDALKQQHPGSRVVSVALKDRAAAVLGGKAADEVYWYQNDTGRFVTSTYYRGDYPAWINAFNNSRPADVFFHKGWSRLLPEAAYDASREDAFAAEADGVRTAFPHSFSGLGAPGPAYHSALRAAPYGDYLVLDLALRAVTALKLGRGDSPDLLFVGASAADGIGHVYGPYSHEVQDYYLRLDRELGSWFAALDKRVGAGRWSLVLSSDHGVMPFPEWLAQQGQDARRIPSSSLMDPAAALVEEAREELGIEAPVQLRDVNGLVLHTPRGDVDERLLRALRARLAQGLHKLDFVADVFTYDELAGASPPARPYGDLYHNSFHPDRSADLMIRVRENYLLTDLRSTTHGSPYRHDTHVPLIFWGAPHPAGVHDGRVRTIDVVPTLARSLRLETGPGTDGRVLDAALFPR